MLKERFGETNQADKYRIEVRNRRRKTGESLQSLHSDIRKLVALVFPELDHRARETIASDYFIDALADPDFALKVCERSPANLDSALRIALQLEVWTKNVDRFGMNNRSIWREKPEKLRKPNYSWKWFKNWQHRLPNCRISYQEKHWEWMPMIRSELGRLAIERHVAEGSTCRSSMKLRRKNFARWGCGSRDHPIRLCPNQSW